MHDERSSDRLRTRPSGVSIGRRWWLIAVCFVGWTAACGHTSPFQKTHTVSDILAAPSQYREKPVRVKGRVTESFIAFQTGYFLLSDGTGSLPVIPSRTFPKVGETVSIEGTVRNSFVIGSSQLTVLEER